MLKVLHLVTSLGGGGAERQLLHLSGGRSPCLTHRVISLTEGGDLLPLFQEAGVYLGSLGMRSGRPSLAAFVKLCRFIKVYQPDILQTWLYHADLMGLAAGKLMGVSQVYWNIRCSGMDFSQYSWATRAVVRCNAHLSSYPEALLFNADAGKRYHQACGFVPKKWVYMPNGFVVPESAEKGNRERKKGALRLKLGIPQEAHVIWYDRTRRSHERSSNLVGGYRASSG